MSNLDFIVVTEVDAGATFAKSVFRRRYNLVPPEFPHHVVAFYRRDDEAFDVACYIHFTDCGEMILCGGACTDNRVLRRMSEQQRDALREVGGVFQLALGWSTRRFGERFAAVFGYSGDTLTRRVTDALGWEQTQHQHLLVHWMQQVDPQRREVMIAKAHSFGAF
jgi:hypothetical protein